MDNFTSFNCSRGFNSLLAINITDYGFDYLNDTQAHGNCTAASAWHNATNQTANATVAAKKFQQIISDEVKDIFLTVNSAILCQIVNVAGIVANVLNICVFVKQGLGDSVNVTLAGLALADLMMVMFAVWLCICLSPYFMKLDLSFSPSQFVYLTAGLPRLTCARVSSWILVFATVERCLCITQPLKFKSIITPKIAYIYIATVYVVMAASILPIYYTTRLVTTFDPEKNKSVVSLGFTDDRFAVDNISFGIGVSLSVSSFLTVAICTVILIWSLKEKTKWRELTVAMVGAQNQATLVSYRNKRVGKIVSIISVVFTICYTPNTINQLVMCLVREFAKNGVEVNANQVFWSVGVLCESINATFNIIIYYNMSSRFRSTLLTIFKKKESTDYEL